MSGESRSPALKYVPGTISDWLGIRLAELLNDVHETIDWIKLMNSIRAYALIENIFNEYSRVQDN